MEKANKAREEAIKKLIGRHKMHPRSAKINELYSKNYGYIWFNVDNWECEAIAHSKVNYSRTKVDIRSYYFTIQLPVRRYKTYEVGPFRNNVPQCDINVWDRHVDAESKLLEILNLAFHQNSKGLVKLYTKKIPCLSCDSVIYKFLEEHPNIEMEVYFEENDDYNCNKGLNGGLII
jgi:hypothetical protein